MTNWGDVPTWLAVFGAFLAAGAALWQLRLQRIQLADQTRVQEREQANQIDVEWQHIDPRALLLPDEYADVDGMLVVVDNSKRPIRYVASKLELVGTGQETVPSRLADLGGELRPYPPNRQEDTFIAVGGPMVGMIKAGAKGGFIWSPATDKSVFWYLRSWVRFTDDADLSWEIDTSLHLQKLRKRDW